MNFITAVVLGYLLWNWPMHTFLTADGLFNGVAIAVFVGVFIIWLRAAIYFLFIDKAPWEK